MFIYKLPIRFKIVNLHIVCGGCERRKPEVVLTEQTWSYVLQGSVRQEQPHIRQALGSSPEVSWCSTSVRAKAGHIRGWNTRHGHLHLRHPEYPWGCSVHEDESRRTWKTSDKSAGLAALWRRRVFV